AVTGAVFSHDGKFIVTASSDQTARIWDAQTGASLSVLRGHTDKIQTVELSPDDRFILTSSSDDTARLALRDIEEVLALARTRVTRALSCDEWETILGDAKYCPGGGTTQNVNVLPTLAPITKIAANPSGTVEETVPPIAEATQTETPNEPTVTDTPDNSPAA